MTFRLSTWVAAFAFVFTATANASCPRQFEEGAAPRAVHAAYAVRVHELCYDAFAVWVSGETRTPLWSAEHLTSASVAAARLQPRHDAFHADANLPRADRAELADYVRSGFDRGHLAPSGDMPSARAQQQSYSLANIVPQNATLNRGLWEELEESARLLAMDDGEVYVVTGPVFTGGEPPVLHGRVAVPQALFKAVYDVRRNAAAAYVAGNSSPARYEMISVEQLRNLIGIDVFPALTDLVKSRAVNLLDPNAHHRDQVADAGTGMPLPMRRVFDVTETADRSPRYPN